MKRYRFETSIQRSTGWGAFVIFPHSVEAEFHTRGRVPVNALLGGLPYQGSLMPAGSGYHRLAVPHAICEQLSKSPGDLIKVELCQDNKPRSVQLPQEFIDLLRKHDLLDRFDRLTLTRRKEYRNWIISAKREDTRLRRIAKALELLGAEKSSGA